MFAVTLSDDFPAEQPSLVLQSVYHRIDGIPCSRYINDYPYSPRWNADEMAERIRYSISVLSIMIFIKIFTTGHILFQLHHNSWNCQKR